MTARIRYKVRGQYLRGADEWVAVSDVNQTTLEVTGQVVDLLVRWVAWFEGRKMSTAERGLCACCLLLVSEQGHAADCQYAMSKAMLEEGEL